MGVNFPGKIAFLGDYFPRLCGIATFTHDLCRSVAAAAPKSNCVVCAVTDPGGRYEYPPDVRFELAEDDLDAYRRAADFLNFSGVDLLCVQHEFGIFGGPSGSHLLVLLKEVRMPVVTTLHTVLSAPNPSQKKVMDELILRSKRIIVMAEKGAEILRSVYHVPNDKIDVIPHGIPDIPFADSARYKPSFGLEDKQVLLTFGLLGPGKGIEYVIEALPEILKTHPEVVYLILGATHPNLVANEGESYRLSLERLAETRGVKEHVIFYNRFVTLDELKKFIGVTDIYVTPYLNEEQITSGTLSYVFGSGKAVISTPYWHAKELLAQDKGCLVPFRDAPAIAIGVKFFLDNPTQLENTQKMAYELGRKMVWSAVAVRYLESFKTACQDQINAAGRTKGGAFFHRPYELPTFKLDHIVNMSDNTGILQHASFNVPNLHMGYCTDDNARAFILCVCLEELGPTFLDKKLGSLDIRYLAFLAAAFNPENGRFRNFMSYDRQWLETAGSEDSHARAIWAMGVGVGRSRNEGHWKLCKQLFDQALPIVETFTSPRAWAFSLLGIHHALCRLTLDDTVVEMQKKLTQKLVDLWKSCATPDWPWFELSLTYDNARLCQALLLNAGAMQDNEALDIGLNALQWFTRIQTTDGGYFRPIGSNGFYKKDGECARFDQQPVEAQAMVDTCITAFQLTSDTRWLSEAKRAFDWFLGRNDLGIALYNFSNGGCKDGLHVDRINENQGAESSLAFHLSLVAMKKANHSLIQPLGDSL